MIIGIIMIIVGFGITKPSDYISYSTATKYVGGDAYNYMIESAIRSGKITSAEISETIYYCAGTLIICMSVLKIRIVKPNDKKT